MHKIFGFPLNGPMYPIHYVEIYTLETQLLKIKMHDNEAADSSINRAEEYDDALTGICERLKDKDMSCS